MPEPEDTRALPGASSPTAVLLGISIAAYAAMTLVGGRHEIAAVSSATLMKFGASYVPLVREGQLHRLVASMFLHMNLVHLAMNAAALLSIGPLLEGSYGRGRFVAIYLIGGLGGSVCSVLWHLRDPVVSAGASGALCAAIGAGIVRAHLDGHSAQRRALALWALATLAFGVLVHADNAAHLGGLVFGAALGWSMRRAVPRGEPGALPAVLSVVVALGAFGGSIALRQKSETAADAINRGVELAHGGDDDGAAAAYRRALELEGDDAVAHFDLGLALERSGKIDEAIRHFERALELEPSDSNRRALVAAHINHGVELSKQGNDAAAIAAYRAALLVDDTNANAHRNLGLALDRSGDRAAAIAEVRHAVELSPAADMKGTLATLLANDGVELAKQGKHAEAIARYQESIALEPDEWRVHFDLGLALSATHDYDGAVKAFEKARQIEPNETTQQGLADAIEARRDARADAGDLGGALDDLGRSTLLRLAAPDAGAH